MRSKPGFTLIEVMTIVAILGIVFLVAYPRFTNVKKLSKTTSKELVANLRNTRSMAISTGITHYLRLGRLVRLSPSSPYTFSPSSPPYAGYEAPGTQVGEIQLIPLDIDGLDRDEVRVTCTATADTFSFNYLGSCIQGDGTITLEGEGATCIVRIIGFTGTAFSP